MYIGKYLNSWAFCFAFTFFCLLLSAFLSHSFFPIDKQFNRIFRVYFIKKYTDWNVQQFELLDYRVGFLVNQMLWHDKF